MPLLHSTAAAESIARGTGSWARSWATSCSRLHSQDCYVCKLTHAYISSQEGLWLVGDKAKAEGRQEGITAISEPNLRGAAHGNIKHCPSRPFQEEGWRPRTTSQPPTAPNGIPCMGPIGVALAGSWICTAAPHSAPARRRTGAPSFLLTTDKCSARGARRRDIVVVDKVPDRTPGRSAKDAQNAKLCCLNSRRWIIRSEHVLNNVPYAHICPRYLPVWRLGRRRVVWIRF